MRDVYYTKYNFWLLTYNANKKCNAIFSILFPFVRKNTPGSRRVFQNRLNFCPLWSTFGYNTWKFLDYKPDYESIFRNVRQYVSNSRPNRRFSTVSPQFRCAESESEIRFPKFDPGRSRETSEICGFLLFL